MKALTLWQPWASLVAAGHKRIETRSWSTRYRGLIAIHAAKESSRELAAAVPLYGELLGPLPRGQVVAFAKLVDCRLGFVPEDPRERQWGHYGPDRFAWLLEGVVALEQPIPWSGAQGLWDVPPDLFARIYGQTIAESPEYRALARSMAGGAPAAETQGRLF